jgi:hypothetical protein
MSLTKLSLGGNNSIIPRQGEFVIDIPAVDGKTAKLFLQCNTGQACTMYMPHKKKKE